MRKSRVIALNATVIIIDAFITDAAIIIMSVNNLPGKGHHKRHARSLRFSAIFICAAFFFFFNNLFL